MDEELQKKIDAVVGLARLAGGTLIIIGSILVFFFFQSAFYPNAVIEINGVPTTDQISKIIAVLFAAIVPLFGMVLSLTPNKTMDKWASKIITHLS
ncbi:hypothetical protein [Thalassotalea maritima]|uniref:hypothetical protein n=1 Tax=Thalassotalea maritima TaxID=3242416 RepID=UPI0035295A9E